MRRLIRIVFSLLIAMLAAAATQVRFALPRSPSISGDISVLLSWWADFAVLTLTTATHIGIFSILFALVAILIGEWQSQREWSYYVLTGVIVALGGFVAQYAAESAKQPTILNNYALIAFITSGAVGGLVYWLLAGHMAGRRRLSSQVTSRVESTISARVERAERTAAPPPVPRTAPSAQTAEAQRDRTVPLTPRMAPTGQTPPQVPQPRTNTSGLRPVPPPAPAAPAGRPGEAAHPTTTSPQVSRTDPTTRPSNLAPPTGPQEARRLSIAPRTVPDTGPSKPAKA